jgi:hypothetical protein
MAYSVNSGPCHRLIALDTWPLSLADWIKLMMAVSTR